MIVYVICVFGFSSQKYSAQLTNFFYIFKEHLRVVQKGGVLQTNLVISAAVQSVSSVVLTSYGARPTTSPYRWNFQHYLVVAIKQSWAYTKHFFTG